MKTCKKLLAITMALVLLVSTLVSGLVVSAADATATLAIGTTTIKEGDTTADVEFVLTFAAPTKTPHSLCTITAADDLTLTAIEVDQAKTEYVKQGEDGQWTDDELIIDEEAMVTIDNNGKNLAAGKVLVESAADSKAPTVRSITFTATFDVAADAAVGDYAVNAEIDATNYDEADYTIAVTAGKVSVVEPPVVEPECEHTNATRELTQATTSILEFTYTCPDCNEVYTETHPVTISSTFKFTHTLNVESDITLNFKIKKSLLTDYTDAFAVFDKALYNEKEFIEYDRIKMLPIQDTTNANNYVFPYVGIAAKEVNSEIIATIYAKNAEGNYVYFTETYNPVSYVNQICDQPTSKSFPETLKTALVDMANYGAKAQLNFKYNTNNLASDSVKAAHQTAYASVARETMTDHTSTTTMSGSVVTAWARTLSMENKVIVNIRMTAPSTLDINSYVLKIDYKDVAGEDATLNVAGDSGKITWNGSRWVYEFDALTAIQFSDTFTATLCDLDGNAVSTSWTSSIESYGAAVLKQPTNSTYTAELKDMLKYMMTYGDSVKTYFYNK